MTIVTARDRAMRLPGIAVLAGYRREWLRGDLLAGVAVAAYLVPQVMAYSGIAGLPAQAGLWACLGSFAIYAVVGSSRQLSVGPESTTALITATAVAPLALGDPARYAAIAAGLALVVGAICLLGGLVRAGSLADLLWSFAPTEPRPAPRTLADVPARTPESTAMAKELKARGFRFVGPTTAYALMQASGMVNDHLATCWVRDLTGR